MLKKSFLKHCKDNHYEINQNQLEIIDDLKETFKSTETKTIVNNSMHNCLCLLALLYSFWGRYWKMFYALAVRSGIDAVHLPFRIAC